MALLGACQPQPPVPAATSIPTASALVPDRPTSTAHPPTATPLAASPTHTASATPKPLPTRLSTPLITTATKTAPDPGKPALVLANGPHLFLDNFLVATSDQVTRRVIQPNRTDPTPLITGLRNPAGDANVDFYSIVLRDAQTGKFRLWHVAYDAAKRERYSAYANSADGLHWTRPFIEVPGTRNTPLLDVVDLGADYAVPAERYQAITRYLTSTISFPSLLTSPDGSRWKTAQPNLSVPVDYGEEWRVFADIGTGGFGFLHRWNEPYTWTDAQGEKHVNTLHDPTFTRIYASSSSPDRVHITHTQVVFAPDSKDSGETQFYAVSNIFHRGDYYLVMLDILRNDQTAAGSPATLNSPEFGQNFPVFGTGYTVLAWSRDGQQWFRDRETNPYFEPDSTVGAWDHAVAWITSVVPVGDAVYLYYGGYQYGHKVFFDRQIGMVETIRDRFVAQGAGLTPGTLRTPLIRFNAAAMTLNVDVRQGGQASVEVFGASGQPLAGFGPGDCTPIRVNSIAAPVECPGSFADLANQPVYLQFELTNADLYAFNLVPAPGAQ